MAKQEKITVNKILFFKKHNRKITVLTAYDYAIAKILDESNIDIVLVGDSMGNVMLGYDNTLPVTLFEMIIHTQAVARGVKNSLIVADLPFGTFQKSKEEALSSAIDLVKAGAQAVKLEGAQYADSIKAIVNAGIPVMGHLGFTPQAVNLLGYKIQGKDKLSQAKLLKDAKALEKAGCFAIVLELIPEALAKKISKAIKIPTIGIGSGKLCDGQVLVTYDMLGIYENPPSFVKKYANIGSEIKKAVSKFREEIAPDPD